MSNINCRWIETERILPQSERSQRGKIQTQSLLIGFLRCFKAATEENDF
jgi:hypothetical protein